MLRFRSIAAVQALMLTIGPALFAELPLPDATLYGQIAAKDGLFGTILDHLLYHAWHRGSVAVSGQLDPLEIQAFWERSCVFHHDGASWVLVHARRREVLEAIHRGDAFLTRLEGEWWIGL